MIQPIAERRLALAAAFLVVVVVAGLAITELTELTHFFRPPARYEKNEKLLYHKLVTVDRSQEVTLPWASSTAEGTFQANWVDPTLKVAITNAEGRRIFLESGRPVSLPEGEWRLQAEKDEVGVFR